MESSPEVVVIIGAVVALLIATATLRLTHFKGNIEELSNTVAGATDKVMGSLRAEIKRGAKADVEAVITMVYSLSPLDQMAKSLRRIKHAMQRGFINDMVSIALLLIVAVLTTAESSLDPVTALLALLAAIFVIAVVSGFVQNVYDLFRVENRLKEPKKR